MAPRVSELAGTEMPAEETPPPVVDRQQNRVSGLTMPEAEPDEFNDLLGARVIVHGLTGRPDLNGCSGRVMSWHQVHGRAGVRLDGETKSIAIRPANLRKEEATTEAVHKPPRVLTVGDGDLSYSLALARAYGSAIELTASTLLREEELLETYAAAAATLAELRERRVCIRHGIDATALERAEPALGRQDHVIFNHPHLGLADLSDVQAHARRHEVLIAHYLASAAALLPSVGGCVHLTLCGNQPKAWSVEAHGRRLGLAPPVWLDVAVPAASAGLVRLGPQGRVTIAPCRAAEEGWAARKRFRNGALGSKHWLSRFGYEHRRSEGDMDMSVDRSVELLWHATPRPDGEALRGVTGTDADGKAGMSSVEGEQHVCTVCGFGFPTVEALSQHVQALGVPEPVAVLREWRQQQLPPPPPPPQPPQPPQPPLQQQEQEQPGECEAVPAPPGPVSGASLTCVHCGDVFTSRTRLFKHLGEGCDTAAPRVRESVRLALLLAYAGARLYGAFHSDSAEEASRPTVGGCVLRAARHVWGASAKEAAQVSVTPLVRTEKHASAFQNWFLLQLPRRPSAEDARSFEERLQGTGIHVLAARASGGRRGSDVDTSLAVTPDFNSLNRPFPRALLPALKRATAKAASTHSAHDGASASSAEPGNSTVSVHGSATVAPRMMPTLDGDGLKLDGRHAAQRLVYKYALPYALLMRVAERRIERMGRPPDTTPDSLQARVWLSGLAEETSEEGVAALLASVELEALGPPVPQSAGFCEMQFASAEAAARAVVVLDGKEWRGRALGAMAAAEALGKLGVHHRVKATLKRLTDGEVSEAAAQMENLTEPRSEVEGRGEGGEGRGEGGEGGEGFVRASRTIKRRPRSFHNFCSEKARLRGAHADARHLQLVLDHCGSSIQDDLRNPKLHLAGQPCAPVEVWEDWAQGDWLVVSFSAREFAPQQVRRMVGALVAVVSGRAEIEYIDRCFSDAEVLTPLAPAEPMWLERIQLSPRAQQAWVAAPCLQVDVLQCQIARLEIERDVRQLGMAALRRFAEELDAQDFS